MRAGSPSRQEKEPEEKERVEARLKTKAEKSGQQSLVLAANYEALCPGP